MDMKRSGSQASGKAPAGYFTGTVLIDPLFQSARSGARFWSQCHLRAPDWMEHVSDEQYAS